MIPVPKRATRTALLLLPWIAVSIVLLLSARWGDRTTVLRDAMIYRRAIESVRSGQGPYAAGLALQQRAWQSGQEQQTWAFVYPPVTLPLIHIAAWMPAWLYEGLYWLAYAVGASAQLWAMFAMLKPAERRVARYLMPACFVLPAFMYSTESLFAGNVVFILYGAILWAAVMGWRKGDWRWFYLVVLVASCIKPQILTLLLLPPLSAAGQWLWAVLTAGGAVSIFAAQTLFFPSTYKEWRHAVDVQLMNYDREFGHGPVGVLGRVLWKRGLAWELPCAIFYLSLALLILAALIYISRMFRAGRVSLADCVPVWLIGVVLLNPRLLGNDIFPLTIPMAAIAWRSAMDLTRSWRVTAALLLLIMLTVNVLELPHRGIVAPTVRFYALAVLLIMLCFLAGIWHVRRQASRSAI